MMRRNREINVFSMSALDLFASALGAFILLTVIFIPFFPNTGDSKERIVDTLTELAAAESRNDSLQSALESRSAELAQCQRELEAQSRANKECRAELNKTFLLIVMSWKTIDDIDLHVVDPSGNEYAYNHRRYSGSVAQFEEDSTRGPGNEIWLHPAATAGEYKVYYTYYAINVAANPSVRGSVVHMGGRKEFPLKTLRAVGERVYVTSIFVSDSGDVSLR